MAMEDRARDDVVTVAERVCTDGHALADDPLDREAAAIDDRRQMLDHRAAAAVRRRWRRRDASGVVGQGRGHGPTGSINPPRSGTGAPRRYGTKADRVKRVRPGATGRSGPHFGIACL